MTRHARRTAAVSFATLVAAFAMAGCLPSSMTGSGSGDGGGGPGRGRTVPTGVTLQLVDWNDPVRPVPTGGPVVVTSAKNEVTGFAVQFSGLPKTDGRTTYALRFTPPKQDGGGTAVIAAGNFSVDQVVDLPVDTNRAGFVRQTGLTAARRPLPRALLPMPTNDGRADLSSLRDPASPTDPAARPAGGDQPVLLWVDLRVPTETPPGAYAGSCELTSSRGGDAIAALPVRIVVSDFVLPAERHVLMVSRPDWQDLRRLYPAGFETARPQLIDRSDKKYEPTLRVLDGLQALAQSHRAQVIFPRLQPVVKWPGGRPPEIDWAAYDALVKPWLGGGGFDDKTPLGYWPLPTTDHLDNYPLIDRLEFFRQSAAHFDALDWLARSAVFVEGASPGRVSAADSIRLSAEAGRLLNLNPRLRVTLPLEEDQIQLAGPDRTTGVNPPDARRLMSAAPGLVFRQPMTTWPADVERPQPWLRTDLPGLLPYLGAGGDERDVRLWAWLAFLRQARPRDPNRPLVTESPMPILWASPLPRTSSPAEPGDPSDLVWFYPGSWFGLPDAAVPSIQLKWLRRAQQDFEYLYLARQRGEAINPLLMARLITRPVQLQPTQPEDPTYALMSGTTDPGAWIDAAALLADTIQLRVPGQAVSRERQNAVYLRTYQWAVPQERPVLMGRTTQWLPDVGPRPARPGASALDPNAQPARETGNWVSLRLGIDVYNASDARPDQNLLQWSAAPRGWQFRPRPDTIPALATYRVDRFTMDARVNLDALAADRQSPAVLTFTNGYNKQETRLPLTLPVAPSDRRGPGLVVDGRLDDWARADAIQSGPMVKMFDRPTLRDTGTAPALLPASVYTGWADENFYVAFKLAGLTPGGAEGSRNFVDYQYRRAWGEDLCELLVQAVYDDGTSGPLLHVVCKPRSGLWVERKLDPRLNSQPWQPFEGAPIPYAARAEGPDWTGEVAIPWKLLATAENANKPPPRLLRFNFAQHARATGESATWAGPVDFGRDDAFTGLIYIRPDDAPGNR